MTPCEEMFAATPPPAANKGSFSVAMTRFATKWARTFHGTQKLLCVSVRRAYSYARAGRGC